MDVLGRSRLFAFLSIQRIAAACRYLSHFRSVHRGAYFAELRTTTVRKLMPEAWGFLCPVHTPDGSPCGLLNHFSAMCRIVTKRADSLEDTDMAIQTVSVVCSSTFQPYVFVHACAHLWLVPLRLTEPLFRHVLHCHKAGRQLGRHRCGHPNSKDTADILV